MTELRTPPPADGAHIDQDGFPAAEPSSTPQAAGKAPASGYSLAGWLRWAWRQLTSMRIALILLFLLALGSIPGSILPQRGTDPGAVGRYFQSHPSLAPLLNHLGLFDVFAAPWFAAIYLLLFTSLVGCVVPRTFRMAGAARSLPPRAPRNLGRLPLNAEYSTGLAPDAALATAARLLGGHGFRLRQPDGTGDGRWLSAEKGYLREAGNLLFHLALLGILISVALGGMFGYKADKLLVEGGTFADTAVGLDEFHPGRLVSGSDLPPFSLTLTKFNASYVTSGAQLGEPASFDAFVRYTATPGGQERSADIQVNHPLSVDGDRIYLLGHGYAPMFKVTDATGKVVFNDAVPFIVGATGDFLSQGVVKVPDARPEQLGFSGAFVPTAVSVNGTLESIFPAPDHPVVSLIAYGGNLGLNSGVSQSVYDLNTSQMHQLAPRPQALQAGQVWTLPGGKGTITFTGYKQWITLQITHDPGQLPALVCGAAALGGLLLSFLVRRRRIFVRIAEADGRSAVQLGGLTRTDASGGFEEEFASLAAELKAAHEASPQRESGD